MLCKNLTIKNYSFHINKSICLRVFLKLTKAVSEVTIVNVSSEFLDSGTTLALAVRAIRYFIITIVVIGVYLLAFKLGDRIFKRKDQTS